MYEGARSMSSVGSILKLHELKNNEGGVEIFKAGIKEAREYIDQRRVQKSL